MLNLLDPKIIFDPAMVHTRHVKYTVMPLKINVAYTSHKIMKLSKNEIL